MARYIGRRDINQIVLERQSPFPKQQILYSYKLRLQTISNLIRMEEGSLNGKKKTLGKGEIALYEQFLLFPTVFPKCLYDRHVKTRACLEKG